jgi:long-chain alkane monooxygenase
MTRAIRFNAFDMNCVGHQSPGLWAHPRDRSWQYKDLEYWTDVAQTLERGIFDGIFIADVIGYYDVYQGNARHAIQQGAQIPVNDPIQLVSAMSLVTKHLGFGITASTGFEHPYPFARRLATADHHSKGRVGWNIVTSYLESGARNTGTDGLPQHNNRYDVADEYLEVIYKLLEGSWEDGAVLRDRERRIFADPAKVHEIKHRGKHFTVPGYHLCEPSPQRTPVLYQAGTSPAGRAFAARHAECVFMSGPSKQVIAPRVASIRKLAVEAGRDPADILIFAMMTAVVGPTDSEAAAKLADYRRYADPEGALTLMSGWTGVDFSRFNPDQVVEHVTNEAGRTAMENITRADPNRRWTVREVAEHVSIGGIGPVIAGSPPSVADRLDEWIEETGVDGFNMAFAVRPETFVDVVDLLVPELQRRGRYKTAYAKGTLREKLFGRRRLRQGHPATAYRWA